MIERIPIESRGQWLALRRQDVTASTAGALLGLDPYKTAYGLWAEKTGAIPDNDNPNAAMRRGLALEPVAIAEIAKLHPDWKLSQPNSYYRDPQARLGATPDVIAEDPERPGLGVIQIKTADQYSFEDKWIADGVVTPPLWVVVQVQIEAHLTGATWAAIAVLAIGAWELHIVDVPLHAPLIARIKAETLAFWKMVDEGREPPPDYGRDADVIEQLFAKPEEIELDLTSDNELPEAVAQYQTLGAGIAALTQERKSYRAQILHRLGNADSALIATGRITAKSIRRKGYVVDESSSRTIRFKEDAV